MPALSPVVVQRIVSVFHERVRGRVRSVEVETFVASIGPPDAHGFPAHRVVFMPHGGHGGIVDGLLVNDTFFSDRGDDDMFCSEMFAALTGVWPYEVAERPVDLRCDMGPVLGDD